LNNCSRALYRRGQITGCIPVALVLHQLSAASVPNEEALTQGRWTRAVPTSDEDVVSVSAEASPFRKRSERSAREEFLIEETLPEWHAEEGRWSSAGIDGTSSTSSVTGSNRRKRRRPSGRQKVHFRAPSARTGCSCGLRASQENCCKWCSFWTSTEPSSSSTRGVSPVGKSSVIGDEGDEPSGGSGGAVRADDAGRAA